MLGHATEFIEQTVEWWSNDLRMLLRVIWARESSLSSSEYIYFGALNCHTPGLPNKKKGVAASCRRRAHKRRDELVFGWAVWAWVGIKGAGGGNGDGLNETRELDLD